jgi:hypothetical protein
MVAAETLGAILLGVINHAIRAKRSNEVHVSRTAHPRHISAEPLGDLYRERAHATRGTVDQDLLPGLNPALIAKTLQRS